MIPLIQGILGLDGEEEAKKGGPGGTRRLQLRRGALGRREWQILRRQRLSGIESIRDGDLTQWDAAGMPQSFYLRLLHAEGESHYRQQFLSLLVCRPRGIGRGNKRHRTDFYLSQAKVKQIAITTVTWTFQGQRDSNRKDPKTLSKPTISITFDTRDENCHSLQDVLELYELLNAFKSPNEEDRH